MRPTARGRPARHRREPRTRARAAGGDVVAAEPSDEVHRPREDPIPACCSKAEFTFENTTLRTEGNVLRERRRRGGRQRSGDLVGGERTLLANAPRGPRPRRAHAQAVDDLAHQSAIDPSVTMTTSASSARYDSTTPG